MQYDKIEETSVIKINLKTLSVLLKWSTNLSVYSDSF